MQNGGNGCNFASAIGNGATATGTRAGENIDNNATGQRPVNQQIAGSYRQRQGDTEKVVSVNLRSSGKPIDEKGYPAKRQNNRLFSERQPE